MHTMLPLPDLSHDLFKSCSRLVNTLLEARIEAIEFTRQSNEHSGMRPPLPYTDESLVDKLSPKPRKCSDLQPRCENRMDAVEVSVSVPKTRVSFVVDTVWKTTTVLHG